MASLAVRCLPVVSVTPSTSAAAGRNDASRCGSCRPCLCALGNRENVVCVSSWRTQGERGARAMAPDEEKMTRRSPLDFPVEWDRPQPGRRPDIFPQFSPMKTPLPQPLPADPPEEEEDEEETKDPEEDPEKEPEKPEGPS